MRIDGVAFVPAKSHQHMGRGDLHVQRVPSSGRIADDGAHPQFSQPIPMRLLAQEPIGVAKFNRNRQFSRPFCQVRPQGIRVLWGKMRRQLDERRPEAIAECKQACDEVIRRALAVVEAAKMRDDLREFGTKTGTLQASHLPTLSFLIRCKCGSGSR